jgi:exodeoxyribonuclease V gamma subunit
MDTPEPTPSARPLPARPLPESSLRVLRGASVDDLVGGLAQRLVSAPPADAMAPVRIAVPSRGMERWLTQRLADHLGALDGEAGVCANIAFPFLGSIVHGALAAVLGDGPDATDPWSPQRLAWPLLGLLDELPEDPVYEPLRSHLLEGSERAHRRRFPLARRIADLFDRYALYRSDMVRRWAEGASLDADGASLPPNVAWQPPLWRAVTERVGRPSLDRRFAAAVAALEAGSVARPDDLPADVTIFGVLSLPPLHLDLLAALARHTEVTIHAVAPCRRWAPGRVPADPRNPLLAASGIAARDAHAAFAAHEGAHVPPPDPTPDDDAAAPAAPSTALAVLQADVRDDRRRGPRAAAAVHLGEADRSVQVHACHGAMRQLEVLREVLFGLFEDDPTLEPRDVVVLTPDIEALAPVITAAFLEGHRPGDHPRGPADRGLPGLPFRVADRTVRDENTVARALLDLLELVTARVGASAVVDLLATRPVSTTFGLSPADLAHLPAWVLGTGTTWGMDAAHRDRLIGLDDAAHTWGAGLDRLVLGAAMADDGTRMVGGVVPYDDVEGPRVELLGRLHQATDALFTALLALSDPRSVEAWREALDATVTALLDPGHGASRDATLTSELAAVREALVEMVRDSAGPTGEPSGVRLTLEEVRTVLGSRLEGRTGGAQYGTGAITFSGLAPLRNVPHRVVCLVGLDDGALPRTHHHHGFDLLATQPRPGDPEPRVEDRQLFLDAILSARDHLVITYTGHDPRTNELQQPAVPVSELLDVLEDSLETGEDGTVRSRVLVSHPLQPHSARYFGATDGAPPVPQAFDPHRLAAAEVAAAERRPAPAFFAHPLPPPGEELLDPVVVELADLVRFLQHPIRHLLQRRLAVSLGGDDRRMTDRDPTELDALERWKLGEDLLGQRLAGPGASRWRELTLACGTVPVGGLGEVALDGIEDLVDRLCTAVGGIDGEPRSLPVDVLLPIPAGDGVAAGGRRLVGSVDLIGTTVTHVSVSRLKAKHQIAAWVRLLAVLAAEPDATATARLLGRDGSLVGGVRKVTLALPVASEPEQAEQADQADQADQARAHLAELVALYLRGFSEPVPLLPEVSYRYARCRADGKGAPEALAQADRTWDDGQDRGEQADAYVVQAFGSDAPLAELVERYGLTELAERVWLPVIAAETRS